MTRALASAIFLAGCASGAGGTIDSPEGNRDAPVGVDARVNRDAVVLVDAPHTDAAVAIDAPHVPIDAPRPIDAREIDAAPPPDACVPISTQLLNNPTFDLTPAGTD